MLQHKLAATRIVVPVFLVFLAAMQSGQVTQTQTDGQSSNPCAAAEQRVRLAELSLSAERVRSGTSEARQKALESDLSLHKKRLDEVEQKLVGATSDITQLDTENRKLKTSVASVIAERDKLKTKIDRANRRFLCEVFHIGCIDER